MGYIIINDNIEVPIEGFQEQIREVDNTQGSNHVATMAVVLDLNNLSDTVFANLGQFLLPNSITSLKFKSAQDSNVIYTTSKYTKLSNINTNFGSLVGASDIQVQAQLNFEAEVNDLFNTPSD